MFTGYVVCVEHYLRINTVYVTQFGHLLISRVDGLRRQLGQPREALMSVDEQVAVERLLRNEPAVVMVGKGLQAMVLAVQGCLNRGVVVLSRDPAVEAQVLRMPTVLAFNHEMLHPELLTAWQQLHAKSPQAYGVYPTFELARFLNAKPSQACAGQSPEQPPTLQLLTRTLDGYTTAADATPLGHQSTGLALLDERSLFMQTPDLQRLLETQRLGYMSVYLDDLRSLPGTLERLRVALAKDLPGLSVQPFYTEEVGLYYRGTMGFLAAVSVFFVALTAAVVGLTLFSLFSMTVSERGTEFGLMMALGYSDVAIARLFAMEGFLLTVLSLGAAVPAALIAKAGIAASNIRIAPPGLAGDARLEILLDPWVVVAFGLPFFCASLFAVHAIAKRKLRSSPIELLTSSSTL